MCGGGGGTFRCKTSCLYVECPPTKHHTSLTHLIRRSLHNGVLHFLSLSVFGCSLLRPPPHGGSEAPSVAMGPLSFAKSPCVLRSVQPRLLLLLAVCFSPCPLALALSLQLGLFLFSCCCSFGFRLSALLRSLLCFVLKGVPL